LSLDLSCCLGCFAQVCSFRLTVSCSHSAEQQQYNVNFALLISLLLVALFAAVCRSAAVLQLLADPQLLQQRRAAAADRLRSLSPTGIQQQQQQPYGQYTSINSSSYAGAQADPFAPTAAAAAAPGTVTATTIYNTGYNSSYNIYNTSASAGSGSSALLPLGGSSSSSSAAAAGGGLAVVTAQGLPAAAGGGLAAGGGFGEAKGVSFEENKLRVAELRQLLAKPENRCGVWLYQKGSEKAATVLNFIHHT
jgi:hypothetical protein